MADEPIRVASTAWTGLPAEPAPPQSSPLTRRRLTSRLELAFCSIIVVGAVLHSVWHRITAGTWCDDCRMSTTSETTTYAGVFAMLVMLIIPFGVRSLVARFGNAAQATQMPRLVPPRPQHDGVTQSSDVGQAAPPGGTD